MDRNQLEQLGNQLRDLGHRRRGLAERMLAEVQEGDNRSSRELYEELSAISEQAISLMTQQKKLFDAELRRMS